MSGTFRALGSLEGLNTEVVLDILEMLAVFEVLVPFEGMYPIMFSDISGMM